MIISRHWLNEIIDISGISTDILIKTLNSIGLEVDSHKSITIPDGVVIGYVKTTSKHPDADKLNICEVDVGSEILQIVCGASNVVSGQYVPVATVGTTMPNGLLIKKAKLRGVESCGMICSSSELGLPKLNDGILPLDSSIGDIVVGKSLKDYPAFNDDIIEIDITPNRGDCQSLHGIARDLCAAFDLNLKEQKAFVEPENALGIGRIISVRNNDILHTSLSYRAFDLVQPLSENLLTSLRLAFIDCQKKGTLNRLCEYYTYITGVIFVSYDYDKLRKDEEKVVFDLKHGEYGQSEIMVSNRKIGIVGINANHDYDVDENTHTIIIQASYSDPKVTSIASAQDKSLVGGEFLYRSNRGSEPNLDFGMDMFFGYISNLNNVKIYAGSQQSLIEPKVVNINFALSELESIIGQSIGKNDVIRILKKLGFEIDFNPETISVHVPLFRHDILNVQDICEEVVRIIGIDNIVPKPLYFMESNRLNSDYKNYKNALKLRQRAVSVGFYESVHYVFDSGKELSELGFDLCKIKISNPINAELDELRTTLTNHLLSSAERNLKNSKKSVKLFEIGHIFDKNAKQSQAIGFVASGLVGDSSISTGAKPGEFDFFKFASLIQNIIGNFNLQPTDKFKFLSPYEQAEIFQNGKSVGWIGRVHESVARSRDLERTYICEIDFSSLSFEPKLASVYSKYPGISRDLSLLVPNNMSYDTISKTIHDLNLKQLREFAPIDIYKDKSLGDNSSISIKFYFQDLERTLEDGEVAVMMDKILSTLNEKLKIGIR